MGHRSTEAARPAVPSVGAAGRTLSGALVADDDRRAAVAELREHCAQGRITIEEFDNRAGEAYDVWSHTDLVRALRDLPDLRAPSTPVATPRVVFDGRPHRDHRHDGRTFSAHLISYLSVMALLIGIWALTTPFGYFWPVWPALGWGVGLFGHGARAATSRASRADRPR